MILFILAINLMISFAVLLLIKKGKINKYACLLRYVNVIQLISILLVPILFILLMFDLPIINDGRAFGILLLLIYGLLGIIVLILNTAILFINYFSHKK